MQRSGVLVGLTSLLVFAPGCGQAPAKLEFEGTSMRISTRSGNQFEQRSARGGGPGTLDPERAPWSRVALDSIVAEAFDVPLNRATDEAEMFSSGAPAFSNDHHWRFVTFPFASTRSEWPASSLKIPSNIVSGAGGIMIER